MGGDGVWSGGIVDLDVLLLRIWGWLRERKGVNSVASASASSASSVVASVVASGVDALGCCWGRRS